LLSEEADPDEARIRHAIAGNLCRCTGYQNIVKAITAAAAAMRGPARRRWRRVMPSRTGAGMGEDHRSAAGERCRRILL